MEQLDSAQPLLNSVSDGTCCESNLLSLRKKEPSTEVEQCTCTNFIESLKNQDQCTVNCCSAVNEEIAIDKEAGVVVDEVFYLLNSFGFFSEVDVISKVDKVVKFDGISLPQGLGYSISSDARVQKCLSKSASFPSSDLDVSHTTSSSKIRSISSTTTTTCNACADQHPAIKRSISLLRNSKLISAMKGGRAQHGNPPSMGVRVKWAADVYDPPAMSVSHTVNSGSYQRTNSSQKKENQKHKNKDKKARRSGSQMKPSTNKNKAGILSEHFSKLQTGAGNRLAQPAAQCSTDEQISASAFGGVQDVKCGTIYLSESHANLCLSFNEAT